MTGPPRAARRSPFAVRGYRYQWSADLMTSCAQEMETIVLGWYIAVQTQSVLLVTLFGALQFVGTLLSPFIGLAGDAIGYRRVLVLMRAVYALVAACLTALVLLDLLTPVLALIGAGIAGLVRPSDPGLRNVLIGETLPDDRLMSGLSLSRITTESARVGGALAGVGVVAALGMGGAYALVVGLYLLGMVLTLGAGGARPQAPGISARRATPSPLRGLWEAARAVWQAPPQLAAMLLAFLINLTAFPFTLGLLPYVAQEVYGTSQAGLAYMVAAVGTGSMVALLVLNRLGATARPGRMMLVFSVAWHGLVILFGQTGTLAFGLPVLLAIGIAQMLCALPISVLLLRGAAPELRGRIMGMRTLAVYGLLVGLLCAGPLIERLGFAATAAAYGAFGIAATLLLLATWRAHLWPPHAPANGG
nr:MFS transporter [Roseomonas sp. MO-31]